MIRRSLAIATVAALAATVAGPAGAATVELRVESSTDPAPLFAGSVTTLPHPVDGGDGSGSHPCAGGPSGPAGATATGALDDAMRGAAISWRGNWDSSFHDFFIDRIGPYASAAPDRYWSLTINGRFASGGCLAQVADGDSVRFFYGPLFGNPEPGAPGGADTPNGPGADGPAHPGAAAAPPTRTRKLAARAAAFLRHSFGAAGAEWGRLALAVRRGDGQGGAAAALLDGRPTQSRDGSLGSDVNATALAVLALEERRRRDARRAARWLASVQGPGGGFGFRPGVPPDVDSTGLAVWALAREGRWPAVQRGVGFLRSAQAADGGFPSLPGGDSNSQSTGLALVALRVAGGDARSPATRRAIGFLASLGRRSGAIAYSAGANPTPAWTTAQALLGLTERAKLLAPAETATPPRPGRCSIPSSARAFWASLTVALRRPAGSSIGAR